MGPELDSKALEGTAALWLQGSTHRIFGKSWLKHLSAWIFHFSAIEILKSSVVHSILLKRFLPVMKSSVNVPTSLLYILQ